MELHYLIDDFKNSLQSAEEKPSFKNFKKFYSDPNKNLFDPLLSLNFFWQTSLSKQVKSLDFNKYRNIIKKVEEWGYPERAKEIIRKACQIVGRNIPGKASLL